MYQYKSDNELSTRTIDDPIPHDKFFDIIALIPKLLIHLNKKRIGGKSGQQQQQQQKQKFTLKSGFPLDLEFGQGARRKGRLFYFMWSPNQMSDWKRKIGTLSFD